MRRFFTLIKIDFKASLRKFLYGFGEEIVVFFCSTILATLFFYMLHDLLHKQMQEVSVVLLSQIKFFFAALLAGASGLVCGSFAVSDAFNSKSLFRWSLEIGEEKKTLLNYLFFSALLKLTFFLSIYLIVSEWIFGQIGTKQSLVLIGLFLCGSAFRGWSLSMTKHSDKNTALFKLPQKLSNQTSVLFFWQIKQLFRLDLLSVIVLLAMFMCFIFCVFFISYQAPSSLIFMCGYGCSLFLSYALCRSFSSHIKHSWIEKQAGVSHESYLSAIERICICSFVSLSVLFFLWVFFWKGGGSSLLEIGQLSLAASSSVSLIPVIFFQIAPKKTLVIFMSTFLLSLFVAAAIFISWFGLLALPVALHYGRSSQKNRFYAA